MANRVLLEVCVQSLDHALAAEVGGADRIELCHDLSCGGITPAPGLMRAVRREVLIPVHGLIRPRAGDFCYSEHELKTIQQEIVTAQGAGLDGIVLGILDPSGHVDREKTSALVQLAHPLPVTFHRAFDRCPDLASALELVIETGAKRILTAGGKPTAMDGLLSLSHLVQAAQDRIVIMPGGGIRSVNVEHLLRRTGAREIHSSLDGSNATGLDAANLLEQRVRELKREMETTWRDLRPDDPLRV